MPNGDKEYDPEFLRWSEKDFRADIRVQALTPIQRWMYRSLLQGAFLESTRPRLLDDDNILWRVAGCESLEQWQDNKRQVLELFETEKDKKGQVLVNKRLEAEWSRIVAKSTQASEAGTKSALARQYSSTDVERTLTSANRSSTIKELEVELDLDKEQELEQEQDSRLPLTKQKRLDKALPILCRKILGLRAEPLGFSVWSEIKQIREAYGSASVLDAFEKWAKENRGMRSTFPLGEFIKVADGLINGIISLEKNQDAEDLAGEIASLTNARVLFTGKDKTDFVQLVDKCGKADTMAAFKKYWQNVEGDEFEEKHTARKFAEGGEYLVKAVRDEQKERERQAALAKWAEEETERLRVKEHEDFLKKQEAQEAERASAIQAIADAFEVSFEEAAQMCSQSNAEAPPSDSLEDSKAQGQTILGSTQNA